MLLYVIGHIGEVIDRLDVIESAPVIGTTIAESCKT